VDGTGPDQSKQQVGKPIHYVTLKLTLTVSTVLVSKPLFLNPIFIPEKKSLFGSICERRIVNSTRKQNK
jgi:hypothetical protein